MTKGMERVSQISQVKESKGFLKRNRRDAWERENREVEELGMESEKRSSLQRRARSLRGIN